MAWLYIAAILSIIGFPGIPIDAKTIADFSRLQREIGTDVYVTDQDGIERVGKLTSATPGGLSLDLGKQVRQISMDHVHAVDRQRDSVRDGFIKGALIGLLVGAVAAQGIDRSDDAWKAYVGSMAFYGSLGVLIDRGHQVRTPLYRAPAGVSLTGRVSW